MTPSTNPLFRAASQGDADSVKALVAEGVDINASSDRGQTALILAAFGGHSDVVELLLDAGADPRTKDSLGLTAQDWAGRRGFQDVADILSGKRPVKRSAQAKVEQQDARDQVVTDPPIEELNVEFRKPESDATPPKQGYERATLPGLAGAILRTRIGNGHARWAAENGAPKAGNPPVPEQVTQDQQARPPVGLANDDILTLPSGSLAAETLRSTSDPLTLPSGNEAPATPMAKTAAVFSEGVAASGLDDSTLSDETAANDQPIDESTLPSGKPQAAAKPVPKVSVRTAGRVAATQAWLEPSEAPNV